MSSDTSFTTSPPRRGRGNRNDSPKSKQQKQKQQADLNVSYESRLVSRDDQKLISKSDQSFFHHDNEEEEDATKKKPDAISQKSQDDEELQPDKSNKLDESNWDDDKNDQEEKKKENQAQKSSTRSRGNRGDSKQKELNTSSTNTRNINPDHQLPTESTGPKMRGNRVPNDKPYQRGFGGSGYTSRPYDRNENDSGYNRNNNRQRGGYRGGARGGYRGGYNGSSSGYRGNYERNYNSQREDQNNQNTNNKFSTDSSEGMNQSTYKNPDFQKKPRHYEDKNNSFNQRESYGRPYNNNEYSGGGYKGNNRQPQVVQKIVEKIVQKEVIKYAQPPRPTGIRVQPSVSMFIKGCKLTLSCRKLQQFEADLLIIPYKTHKLQLYPGYFVNSCQVNYKAKLKQKGPDLSQKGKLVYMQKCIGQKKFKAFAFLNVADAQNNIKAGIKQVLQNVKLISNNKQTDENRFKSIVFPISSQLGQSKTVLSTLINELENYSSFVKDVYVLAEEYKAFCQAMTKFNEIFLELFEENELS